MKERTYRAVEAGQTKGWLVPLDARSVYTCTEVQNIPWQIAAIAQDLSEDAGEVLLDWLEEHGDHRPWLRQKSSPEEGAPGWVRQAWFNNWLEQVNLVREDVLRMASRDGAPSMINADGVLLFNNPERLEVYKHTQAKGQEPGGPSLPGLRIVAEGFPSKYLRDVGYENVRMHLSVVAVYHRLCTYRLDNIRTVRWDTRVGLGKLGIEIDGYFSGKY